MRPLMEHVDVCIANEEDAEKCLGMSAGETDVEGAELDESGYAGLAERLRDTFGFDAVAITLRESHSASDNGWSAMILGGAGSAASTSAPHRSQHYDVRLVDRVGGGDSFAGGLIHGLLAKANSRGGPGVCGGRERTEADHSGRRQPRLGGRGREARRRLGLGTSRAVSALSPIRCPFFLLRIPSPPLMRALLLTLLLVAAPSAMAQLRLPVLLSDGAVLQRGEPVPVWGWAKAGEAVTVRLGGARVTTEAGADGRWRVLVPALAVGGPYLLDVRSAGEHVQAEDLLVGDVWVLSGQSNMQWTVEDSNDGAAEVAAANDTRIRHLRVPRAASDAPAEDLTGGVWEPATPEHVGSFSGVGYFFARDLRRARRCADRADPHVVGRQPDRAVDECADAGPRRGGHLDGARRHPCRPSGGRGRPSRAPRRDVPGRGL